MMEAKIFALCSVQENHVFARFSGFLWQLGSWFSCFLFIWGWPGATVFSRKRAKNELSRLDFGPHLHCIDPVWK